MTGQSKSGPSARQPGQETLAPNVLGSPTRDRVIIRASLVVSSPYCSWYFIHVPIKLKRVIRVGYCWEVRHLAAVCVSESNTA